MTSPDLASACRPAWRAPTSRSHPDPCWCSPPDPRPRPPEPPASMILCHQQLRSKTKGLESHSSPWESRPSTRRSCGHCPCVSRARAPWPRPGRRARTAARKTAARSALRGPSRSGKNIERSVFSENVAFLKHPQLFFLHSF